jgi:hypothetical protein
MTTNLSASAVIVLAATAVCLVKVGAAAVRIARHVKKTKHHMPKNAPFSGVVIEGQFTVVN